MSRSFASVTIKGTVRHDQIWWAIGVDAEPMGSDGLNMPIGMALSGGRTAEGFKLFRLVLEGGGDLPGKWLLVDGVFVQAE